MSLILLQGLNDQINSENSIPVTALRRTLETLVNVATVDVFICATEKNIVDVQE